MRWERAPVRHAQSSRSISTRIAGQADRVSARAVLDLDTPQLKGVTTLTAKPAIAAINGIDIEARQAQRNRGRIETVVGAGRAHCWRCWASTAPSRQARDPRNSRVRQTARGVRRSRLKARISGAGLDAEAQGTAEPWAQETKASVNLKIGSVNLAPLLDLKPADKLAQNIGLTSRLTVAGNKWTFDDLDSSIDGSRLRGRVALTLDEEKTIEGEIGLDTLALAPTFALAIGAAGHDTAEPLGAGLVKGWRGRIAFQALARRFAGRRRVAAGQRHGQGRRPVAGL